MLRGSRACPRGYYEETASVYREVNKRICWSALIPGYYLVFGHPTYRRLPGELSGTSQLKCLHEYEPSAWRSLVETATSIQGQATR